MSLSDCRYVLLRAGELAASRPSTSYCQAAPREGTSHRTPPLGTVTGPSSSGSCCSWVAQVPDYDAASSRAALDLGCAQPAAGNLPTCSSRGLRLPLAADTVMQQLVLAMCKQCSSHLWHHELLHTVQEGPCSADAQASAWLLLCQLVAISRHVTGNMQYKLTIAWRALQRTGHHCSRPHQMCPRSGTKQILGVRDPPGPRRCEVA